jgi:dienelactone hydrolase
MSTLALPRSRSAAPGEYTNMGRTLALALPALFFLAACELVSSGGDNEEPLETTLEMPTPSGPFSVGTTSIFVVDADRDDAYTPEADQRELNVRIWYPTDQPGLGTVAYLNEAVSDLFSVTQDYLPPEEMAQAISRLDTRVTTGASIASSVPELPIVFWSHGLGGVNSLYTTFASELASQGFLVVAIDHTYGAFATVFPDGTIKSIKTGASAPEFPVVVRIWAEDMASVLDELEILNANDPAGLLTGRLDLSRVGAIGHSTGGSAAAEVHTFDDRFSAAVSLDGPQVGEAAEGVGVDDPLLLFFASPSEYVDTAVADRLTAPGISLTMDQSTHYSFTDLPVLLELAQVPAAVRAASSRPPGTLSPFRNLQVINDWSTAFFDRYLRDGPDSILDDQGTLYPELTVQRIGILGRAGM